MSVQSQRRIVHDASARMIMIRGLEKAIDSGEVPDFVNEYTLLYVLEDLNLLWGFVRQVAKGKWKVNQLRKDARKLWKEDEPGVQDDTSRS